MRRLFSLSFALLLSAGCTSQHTPRKTGEEASATFQRVEAAGITNFYYLGHGIYSGAAPEGDAGFASLRTLGIKTIITVDGAAPAVELAAKHGLRYVHIPVGYDGIAPKSELMLLKAAETLPGPIFVHCHHGTHRGPTAAAIICEAVEGWTAEQAETWLRVAGTDTNYPGLYRTARDFRRPSNAELQAAPSEFPTRATTPPLVGTMVQIDDRFAAVKQTQRTQSEASANKRAAATESLLLLELFREARRTGQGVERGAEFQAMLARAENAATELHQQCQQPESKTSDANAVSIAKMSQFCSSCHRAYRD
jgi:protein tyrosine phosphatase (PTP) superfamily phosphohydrolase (DUF442 family)